MDQIDRKIISILLNDCRTTYEAIARETRVSSNSIKRRVQKLEEAEVIRRYYIAPSLEIANVHQMLTLVGTEGTGQDHKIIDSIGAHPFAVRVGFDSHGTIVIWTEYTTNDALLEFSSFLKSHEGTTYVEFNPLTAANRGKSAKLSKIQWKILRILYDDPKMAISEITKRSNLSARRIKRELDKIYASQAFHFTADIEWAALKDATRFVVRLNYDQSKISPEDIIEWCKKTYPDKYYFEHTSALYPRMFLIFIGDHMRDSEEVVLELSKLPNVQYEMTVFPYPAKFFPSIRGEFMVRNFEEQGLWP